MSIIVAMLSWALYSALLKRKKLELSQLSLLQVIISAGLVFLLPVYLIEMSLGRRVALELHSVQSATGSESKLCLNSNS